MKNPIVWIDERLLHTTEKFVRWFSWLMGVDNFWLAKQAAIIGTVCLLIGRLISGASTTSVALDVFIFLAWWNASIGIAEQEQGREILQGTKDLELCSFTSSLRLFILLLTPVGWLISIFHETPGWTVVWMEGFNFSWLAVLYLISIDKPPFSRSMAWQWLKRKLNAMAEWLVPQPAPQPVPIPVRD